MKKYLKLFSCLIALGIIFSFASCSDDGEKFVPREGNDIETFKIASLKLEGVITKGSTIIEIPVSFNYDLTQLKNVAPSITISLGATISPAENAVQDFSKNVEYTVTAQNGDVKKWTVTVKRDKYTPGIGKYSKLWLTSKDDGAAAGDEAALAVLGNKLVLARTGQILNSATGAIEKDGQGNPIILNMEGMIGHETDATRNRPFIVANDDKGNFIGCTLGAWSTPHFRIYKWTATDKAPTLILTYTDATIAPGFGRKLAVVGDINGNGYITMLDVKNFNTTEKDTHYIFAVTGGKVSTVPTTNSTGFIVKSPYQKLIPASTTATAPYYFGGPGNAGTGSTLQYKLADGTVGTIIQGPLLGTAADDAAFKNGWGNLISDIQKIKFNGKEYIAVLHLTNQSGTNVKYYISLVDIKDTSLFSIPFSVEIPFTQNYSVNSNGTAGLAVGQEVKDADGLIKMKLYGLFTGFGVVAYELTNEAL